jgi:hypothetical protein
VADAALAGGDPQRRGGRAGLAALGRLRMNQFCERASLNVRFGWCPNLSEALPSAHKIPLIPAKAGTRAKSFVPAFPGTNGRDGVAAGPACSDRG